MTVHKFTDDEIIKALERLREMAEYIPPICHYEKGITEPPFCKPYEQFQNDAKVDLAVVNRQKAEIERLQKLGAAATRRLVEVKAEANKEIERMKEEVNKYPCRVRMNENSIVRSKSLEDYDRLIGDISAEAIKEFAERLKSHLIIYTYINLNDAVDTLVKEMTEELK